MTTKLEKLLNSYHESKTDILGSYTGLPSFDDEPIQDADDL